MLLNNLSIENIHTNNIDDILNEIREVKNSNKNTNTILLNILIKLCKDFKKCDAGIIFKVCLTICQEITELTSALKDKYLRIMYFVIQYLLEKTNYKEISILLDYMVPTWGPLSVVESSLQVNYSSLFPLVYNITNSCMKAGEDSNIIEELLIKTLIIQINGKPTNSVSVISTVNQFVNTMTICKLKNSLSVEEIYKIHMRILNYLLTQSINLKPLELPMIFRFQFVSISLFSELLFDKLNEITLKFENLLCNLNQIENVFVVDLIRDLFLLFPDNLNIGNLMNIKRNVEMCSENTQVLNIFASIIEKSINVCSKFDIKNVLIVETLLDILLYIGGKLDVENVNAQKLYGKCTRCVSCNSNLALDNFIGINLIILKLEMNFRPIVNSNIRLKIQQSFEYIEKGIRLLKSNLCTSWDSFFINSTLYYFNYLNNYSKGRDKSCLPMVIQFSKILFEYFDDDLNYKTTYYEIIKKTIHLIVAINYDLGNHKTCLEALVLLGVLFNDDVKLLHLWVTIQLNNVDVITMVDILQNDVQNIRLYYPNFNFTNGSLVSIAYLELRVYNTFGSLQNPMIKCCKFILQNTDCVYSKGRLLQMLWMVGIPLNDELWDELNFIIECFNTKLKKKKKTDNLVNWRLVLANLYILKYTSGMKNIMKQKLNDLFHSSDKEGENGTTCGTIKNEEDSFKDIEMAVANWLIILESHKELIAEMNDHNTLEIIYRVIIIYELHNHSVRSIQSILILYRMSELAKNNIFKLKALAYLLKYVTCSEIYSQLIDEGSQILNNLDENDADAVSEKCYLELLFLLHKSYNLLMRGNYMEGYAILETVHEKYNNSGVGKNNKVFEVYIYFLRIRYLNLPCYIAVDNEHASLLSNATKCFELATILFKKISQRNEWSNDFLIILHYFIEISYWISTLYLNLCQSRESRCYTKNVIKMLSTLNLPIRYAQTLCIQCKLDLLCTNYDACHIKFDKMLDTLCIEKSTSVHFENEICKVNEKLDHLTIHQNNIDTLLDIRITVPRITYNNNTPIQVNDNFILSHVEDCICFLCTSYSYHLLCFESLLIYIHLTKCEFISCDNRIKETQKTMELFLNTMKNVTLKVPNFEINLYPNAALKQIQTEIYISYYKYIIKICNELFIKTDYEKALNILTNILITFDNNNVVHSSQTIIINETLNLIGKISQCLKQNTGKTRSVSICTPEKPIRNALLFTTPSARINKFFKERAPDLTPASIKIYTPKIEKKDRIPTLTDVRPRVNKFFKEHPPHSIKIYTPKIEKKNRTDVDPKKTKAVSPNLLNIEGLYTPYKDDQIIKNVGREKIEVKQKENKYLYLKPKKLIDIKVSNSSGSSDQPRVYSRNESCSSGVTDELEGDDEVFINDENKVTLDNKIKKVVTKNKQVRNKSAVKIQTDHFCTTISDLNDNNSDNCLTYKHTYLKSSVTDQLSEDFLKLEIGNISEMTATHTSPPIVKKNTNKLKKITKRIVSHEDEEYTEVEPRRIYTRRAKKIENMDLIETDDKSMDKASPEVHVPKIPKKMVKTTKKVIKPKQKTSNSSPNSSESTPKPRKKAKNPFIL